MSRIKQEGFTFLEILIAVGVFATFLYISMLGFDAALNAQKQANLLSTRNRLAQTMSELTSMAATLRNSALAGTGSSAVNPELFNCVSGKVLNACISHKVTPVKLFLPMRMVDAGGQQSLVQFTSQALGVDEIAYNENAELCEKGEEWCYLKVITTITPQCGAAPVTYPLPNNVFAPTNLMAPVANCSVAEYIRIDYQIVLDQNVVKKKPSHYSHIQPMSGASLISVRAITNNGPR